jgi:hypothetical protein
VTTTLPSAEPCAQAVPDFSAWLLSQMRAVCGAAPAGTAQWSFSFAPGVHVSRSDCLWKPQLRSGPSCPRAHGAVTKLSPSAGSSTSSAWALLASQPGVKSHRGRSTG